MEISRAPFSEFRYEIRWALGSRIRENSDARHSVAEFVRILIRDLEYPAPLRISVIIPVINEQDSIAACIASAQQAQCDEVIVVDGGSSDRTIEIVRQSTAQLIEARPGRALQQNAGAVVATGDLFLFLHADNQLGPECCSQIRAAYRPGVRLVGAFRQRIDSERIPFRLIEWGNSVRARWRRVAYGDQGIFLDRLTFHDISGFPEVPLLEDLLLMGKLKSIARLTLLDGPIHVSPRRWERHGILRQTIRNRAILIAHSLGASPEQLAKQYRRHDSR